MDELTLDRRLIDEAARAFESASGLGCVAKDAKGEETLCACGPTCADCRLCDALGRDPAACARSHLYGMAEAERFGGRYIYFCQRGLTFFTSPLVGQRESEARLTAGPFRMVTADDFAAYELEERLSLPPERVAMLLPLAEAVPFVAPERVTQLSILLFMAAGFINNVSASARMREQEAADLLQGQISAYIVEVKKGGQTDAPYPLDKENALLAAIREGETREANRLLNELLGHVLLVSGASFAKMKARINELLSLMSRAAIDGGASPDGMLADMERYFAELPRIADMDALCRWLTVAMNNMLHSGFREAGHQNAIHRALQYIHRHLSERLELERIAREACLSTDYFGRVFKQETGKTVRQYVEDARLKRGSELLRYPELSVAEVAQAVGFEEQSYFARVFRRRYGQSPREFRHGENKSRKSIQTDAEVQA